MDDFIVELVRLVKRASMVGTQDIDRTTAIYSLGVAGWYCNDAMELANPDQRSDLQHVSDRLRQGEGSIRAGKPIDADFILEPIADVIANIKEEDPANA